MPTECRWGSYAGDSRRLKQRKFFTSMKEDAFKLPMRRSPSRKIRKPHRAKSAGFSGAEDRPDDLGPRQGSHSPRIYKNDLSEKKHCYRIWRARAEKSPCGASPHEDMSAKLKKRARVYNYSDKGFGTRSTPPRTHFFSYAPSDIRLWTTLATTGEPYTVLCSGGGRYAHRICVAKCAREFWHFGPI